ncbi:MAG: sulfatase [Mediterranea sp.]|jgi:uncharacterized sulfatase|nr:sulfatase [Mediterranea sp.]
MNTQLSTGIFTRGSGKLQTALALLPLFPTAALAQQATDKAAETERPNILFIMSDDHAREAISLYGYSIGKVAPTPNIDRIGREGAIFLNNYCANSISGPSRATILTGKHSHKNGFTKNDGRGFDGSQETLPKIMQANGYETAIIGKWHLTSQPTGFDHWMILKDQGDYCNPYFITPEGMKRHDGYVTDLITQYTEQWLDSRKDKRKPFFLMMHHKAVHRNWVPAERHYHLYEHTTFPMPDDFFDDYHGRYAAARQRMNIYRDMYEGHDLKMVAGIDSDSLLFDRWPQAFFGTMYPDERRRFLDAYRERNNEFYSRKRTPREVAQWKYQRYMQDYMRTVASLDESVGEILDYLHRTGLDKNTIVVYTSDQGFFLGQHGWFDKRWMYEESFVMPMVMRWPGHIKPGTRVTGLTQNIDFAPTFLDMCGISVPKDMQGVSFKKLVETGHTPKGWRRSLYYHYYEFPGFHSVRAHYGVKMGDCKLIHFYVDDKWELYDLKKDPEELHNLYGEKGTEKLEKKMRTELHRLQLQYDAPELHDASIKDPY